MNGRNVRMVSVGPAKGLQLMETRHTRLKAHDWPCENGFPTLEG
jgi:hypothetical protein